MAFQRLLVWNKLLLHMVLNLTAARGEQKQSVLREREGERERKRERKREGEEGQGWVRGGEKEEKRETARQRARVTREPRAEGSLSFS